MVDKEQILNAHPLWKKHISRWEFLLASYLGGQHYRDGKYLTAYMMENEVDYEQRLDSTPLDNHVKALIDIYNSFLFRKPPEREFGSLEGDQVINEFLEDADLDGRSFQTVMQDISAYSSVYGHIWAVIDKPNVAVSTRADELAAGIRPYISIYTPENVLDWRYQRTPTGFYELVYIKLYEGQVGDKEYFRILTKDTIETVSIAKGADPLLESQIPNQLGQVPAVCVYGRRSPWKGIGVSDVGDVADMQRAIYGELSENEQILRLTNHPSLVKTPSTQAAAGAGSIIQMPDDVTDAQKPYLLQPNGSSIDGILGSMKHKIEAIDRMSHMGGIRSIESRRLSGVALATEFQLLNARLAEKAQLLEHAEEQMWKLFASWQGVEWTGEIKYPDSFNIQDRYNDMNMLKLAKDSNPRADVVHEEIERQMLRVLIEDDSEYTELAQRVNFVTETEISGRYHVDGTPISDNLPYAYKHADTAGVPEGQECDNCAAYNEETKQCSIWNAPVHHEYWCKKWILKIETE